MSFTMNKLRSLMKKWHTLIEAHVDVKTTDNYMLRLFCTGFTKRRPNRVKRTSYAQASQIRHVTILEIPHVLLYLLACWLSHHINTISICRFFGRWLKSWATKLQLVIWKSSCPSLFLRSLESESRMPPLAYSPCKMSSSARWRPWKHQSLTLESSWR